MQSFFCRPTALEFTLSFEDGEERLLSDIEYIIQRVEDFNKLASNCILNKIKSIKILFHSFLAYGGGSSAGHCQLPQSIVRGRCLLNLKNIPNDECFKCAIMASIHHAEIENNQAYNA